MKHGAGSRPSLIYNVRPPLVLVDELPFLLTAFIEILRYNAAVVIDANGNATFDIGAPEILKHISDDGMRPCAIFGHRRRGEELSDEIVTDRRTILFREQSPGFKKPFS